MPADLPAQTAQDILGAAAQLTRAQADALAGLLIEGSASRWRHASAFCAKENEAAGIALMRSDMGVYWQVAEWHRQAMRVTAAHGRFGAIVAVRHTITALAAVDLVDIRAERRGWSPDAYERLTSAWTTVVGPVRPAPQPLQPVLDLGGWEPLATTPVGATAPLWDDDEAGRG